MRYQDVPHVEFKGVKVSNTCYRTVLETVAGMVRSKERGYICLTDVSNLMFASKHEWLRTAINDSLFSLPDGTPLVWFAWMAGCKEIERISGASLLQRLLTDLEGCRHYLLGDTEETIAKVIARARELNPRIDISGYSPPFKEFDRDDDNDMLERIRKADADVIWVSFGGGKQERWMRHNLAALDAGVMIGVGAAFRFFTGDIVTPPQFIQKLGLQWVFRIADGLVHNPVQCVKTVHEREILKSKFTFLRHFPSQLKAAREKIDLVRGA